MTTVFIVFESDFAHPTIVKVVDSLDKARVIQAEKELSNNKDWIKYRIEEWDVE